MCYALGIFSILYTATNTYADVLNQSVTLPNVANVLFNIDSHIPFIDSMIVPYACSLPFFMASFFMVNTQVQLVRLTHKLLLATLLACLCFYAMPLQFSYDVSAQLTHSKHWQWAYQLLHSMDKPYNQLPSLHVVYAIVLLQSVWGSLASWLSKVAMTCLSVAIAVATVFTWQHHVLDLFAGVLLATVVLAIEHVLHKHLPSANKSSAVKYAVIAVVCFLLVNIAGFLSLGKHHWFVTVFACYLLLSFLLVAWSYITASHEAITKTTSGFSLATWLVFAPLLMVYKVLWFGASRLHLLQIPNRSNILQIDKYVSGQTYQLDLIATGKPDKHHGDFLTLLGQYDHVVWLDLTCELSSVHDQLLSLSAKIFHMHMPVLDVASWDSKVCSRVKNCCEQLDQQIEKQLGQTTQNTVKPKVLIVSQCGMGWSRSVAMLSCIATFYGQLDQKALEAKYPKSHVNDILNDSLLLGLSSQLAAT